MGGEPIAARAWWMLSQQVSVDGVNMVVFRLG